eukprot:1169623-Rhodomonas_salina.2
MLLCVQYALCGTERDYAATRVLRDVSYWARLCCYALNTPCPAVCYALCGTERGYAATRPGSSRTA